MPKHATKFESYVGEHRIRNGISQEELARQVGVSKETIRNIEKGTSVPNVLLAIGIAVLLGVAVTELFKERG